MIDKSRKTTYSVLKNVLVDEETYHSVSHGILEQLVSLLWDLDTEDDIRFGSRIKCFHITEWCDKFEISGVSYARQILEYGYFPLLRVLPESAITFTGRIEVHAETSVDSGWFELRDGRLMYVLETPVKLYVDIEMRIRVPKRLVNQYPHIEQLPPGKVTFERNIRIVHRNNPIQVPIKLIGAYQITKGKRETYAWIFKLSDVN